MKLKIFKIEKDHSSISFCPERGGLITSIIIKGKELLFMNEETLSDVSKSIRGGIPVLFPNAGIIPDEQLDYGFNLKQHGFVRNIPWNYQILAKNKFAMTLTQDIGTRDMFDYNFGLEITGEIMKNGGIKITQNVINTGLKDLPISCGLHPYFMIPQNKKNEIKFNYRGGEIIEQNIGDRANGMKTVVKNPGKFSVFIPGTGEIEFNYSKLFEQIWIRSESGQDFVCIEPIMREETSILYNPYMVKVGETVNLEMKFGL